MTAKSELRRTVFGIILFMSGFFVIFAMNNSVKSGVESGISLCLGVLVPSLFLPLILCSFLQLCGFLELIGKPLDKFARFAFRLNGISFAAFIMSCISGYPIGAVLTRALYDNGMIDKPTARRLSRCSINAGPAFIVLGVGFGMMKSMKIGVFLLIIHLICAIALLIITRFTEKGNDMIIKPDFAKTKNCDMSFSEICVKSVERATKSMAMICAYTVIFSAVVSSVGSFNIDAALKSMIIGVSEVTNACLYFSGSLNLPMISAALGFSGLSVIAQVTAALGGLSDVKKVIIYRLIFAIISFFLCRSALIIFPISQSVALSNGKVIIQVSSSTMIITLLLLISSFVVLCSIYQHKSKKIMDFFR